MTTYNRGAIAQVQTAVGTTGGAAIGMPNWGVSLVAATSTEVYVLAPPEAGITKRIICTSSSTTITPLVRASTAQTITIGGPGANVQNTMFRFAATRSTLAYTVVDLVGLSSVAWAVANVFPCMSTGGGNGSITLSTT
jgi:hypothetical protein